MLKFESQVKSPDLQHFLKNIEADTNEKVGMILEFVRKDLLIYLKGYTTRMAPPDYRVSYYGKDPKAPRPTHPGGWADISGGLKKGYKAEVRTVADGGHQLVVWNDAVTEKGNNQAQYIEAMTGMFVVSGIMDPDGPVAYQVRQAIKKLAPGWVVTAEGGNLNVNRS